MSGHGGHGNPNDPEHRITYFGVTHTRGKREMFGIRAIDRGKHMYVIGKTGMGKSTMLENMAIQDIQNGEGICFIDPHGSTAEKLLDFVPYERINDIIYFAPFDTEHPLGFNVMEDVGYDKRHLVVSGLIGAFKRIWVDAWSARMEYILQNTLLALLEYPGSTILDVNRMLTNKSFRAAVVEKITDPIVRAFWTEEFANFTDSYTREATPAIQNKVGAFVSNPLIRNIVGQPVSSFDLRKVMDEKKIFIVNLSKGRMGEANASLLGSMLTVKIYLSAMSRADEPASVLARLPRCYFYVDEFQSMMNEAFADILSESRKYKLALTLANQYVEQMEEKVRFAVFGNVGTLICFRVGPFDAEVLQTIFEPTFEAEDLIGLGIGQIYLTLMIDGVGSPPFSAETIAPIETPRISYKDDVINHSRAIYGRHRAEVERVINQKQADFAPPEKEKKGSAPTGFRPASPAGGRGGAANPGLRDSPQSGFRQSPRPRFAAPPLSSESNQNNHRPERREESADGAGRNSLRDAIAAARHAEPQPAATINNQPVRSPADILRARTIAKGERPAEQSPAPRREPRFVEAPREPQVQEKRKMFTEEPRAFEPPRPRSARSLSAADAEQAEKAFRSGEVAPEVLEQILNGTSD